MPCPNEMNWTLEKENTYYLVCTLTLLIIFFITKSLQIDVLIIYIAKSRILTLCQGIMLLKTYDGEKKKFVVLESGKLQIFEKEEDYDPDSGAEIKIDVASSTCKVSFDVKGKIFTLKSSDGKNLTRDTKRVELIATENIENWTNAFKQVTLDRPVHKI